MGLPKAYFRAGAGAVIADDRGRVLALERSDIPGAWQFPQGGLEKDEEPVDAVYREIEEETCLPRRALQLESVYPDLLVYQLPKRARSKKTGLGQVQYWFFFRLRKPADKKKVRPMGEFMSAEWRAFDRVIAEAIPFRKAIYEKLRVSFRSHRHLHKKAPVVAARAEARKRR
jgi:putative (di)nucleoside polyphosphate hydrolase